MSLTQQVLELLGRNDIESAGTLCHDQLKQGNRTGEIYGLTAFLKDLCGMPNDAYRLSKQGVKNDPDSVVALSVGIPIALKFKEKETASLLVDRLNGLLDAGKVATPEYRRLAKWSLGAWYLSQKQHKLAERMFGEVLDEDKTFISALLGLAFAYIAQWRLDEAEAIYNRLLDAETLQASCYSGLAVVEFFRGNYRREELMYRQSLNQNPAASETHINLGMNLLRQQKWDEAWEHYQMRFLNPGQGRHPACIDTPIWRGESLAGKRLLVWGEQGLGDEINFFGAIKVLRDRGLDADKAASLTYATHYPTYRLAHASPQAEGWSISTWQQAAEEKWDYCISQFSIAHLLAPDELHLCAGRFNKPTVERDGKFRVAIVWKGSSEHTNDANRSIDVELLRPLKEVCDEVVSLQYRATDVPSWATDWGGKIGDFADTALLLAHCDVLVSVCSSPLHLAGALGMKAIDLLATPTHDWRWGDGTYQPYYENVKLVSCSPLNRQAGIAEAVRLVAGLRVGNW
jgi:hypothetical protein